MNVTLRWMNEWMNEWLKFNVILERYGDDNQLRWFLIKMTSIPKEREVNTPVFVEVVFKPKNYSNYHNCD